MTSVGEDVGEREAAVLEELPPEEAHLIAKGASGENAASLASLPVTEGLSSSILPREARFAYVASAVRLAEIYVPFVDATDASFVLDFAEIEGAGLRLVRSELKLLDEKVATFDKSDPKRRGQHGAGGAVSA